MTTYLHSEPLGLRSALDDIIETHGRWRVMLAVFLRPMRPKPPLPPLRLSDHLRRDIGLGPVAPWGDPLL
ncbi:MAG: hypothetical protein EON48_10635 [Acetobacteraceae bacterium]|nr:MAG: hypothetical protein EON48_10635 [Acetobacteraceae bacterium]